MRSPDVLVIGAGHNGLICAAYLAQAGVRTQVLERRHIPGGCTATEEMAPGIRINRCFCDHLFLYTTPIPAELELERYGLENLEIDPCHWSPALDDEGLVFWKDVERTADGIGRPPLAAARRMLRRPGRTLAGARRLPMLQRAQAASIRDLLDATFEDEHLKGVLAFISAAIPGLRPSAPGSAMFAFGTILHHVAGARRPRGGSGGLVRALVAAIEAHGGSVRTDAAVQKIRVEDGAVRGVRLHAGEEIEARSIVAACDPQTTFLRLLEPEAVPDKIRRAIERLEIANGFALKTDYVVDRLPEWRPHALATREEQLQATAYISPSIEYLERAYDDYARRQNPRHSRVFSWARRPLRIRAC
jgi:phytoene dehydrogenase-like protein